MDFDPKLRDKAIKIAKRSPHKRFQTGCILILDDEIIGSGWAHPPEERLLLFSRHAEAHMMKRVNPIDISGSTCVIVTISRKSGSLTSARPCWDCVCLLVERGVKQVLYSTRTGFESLDLSEELKIVEFKDYRKKNARL